MLGKPCDRIRDSGCPGRPGAYVERTAFVVPILPHQHRVPVDRAKERPGGNRTDVDAVILCFFSCFPSIEEPTQLFVARGPIVQFRYRDRQVIAAPGFLDPTLEASIVPSGRANRGDVDIGVSAISADLLTWISLVRSSRNRSLVR